MFNNQATLTVTDDDNDGFLVEFELPEVPNNEFHRSHLFVAALSYLMTYDQNFAGEVIKRAADKWVKDPNFTS